MISVFISYAHTDEKLKDQLLTHLSALRREGLIGIWHDRMLKPGEHLDQAIEVKLAASDLIILLVSPAFIASDYCSEREMIRAFQRAQSGKAKVVAFILRPCRWQNLPLLNNLKLGDFMAVPRDGKAVITWKPLDEAFDDGVGAIRDLIINWGGKNLNNHHLAGRETARPTQVLPRPTEKTGSEQNVRTRSRSPNLPRRFTDFDRDTFMDDAFEVIALSFKERLAKLEQENEGIKTRFQRVDAHCLTATIYSHGDMAGGAKVYRSGMSHRDNSIQLSYDLSTARNSYNESLTVEHDDERLYLKAAGLAHLMGGGDVESQMLGPSEAADYLWSAMMSELQARIRNS
jgi:TIR domain